MKVKTTEKERRQALYDAEQAARSLRNALRRAERLAEWCRMKIKHPDAIVLFRVGDFYECYHEDAKAAAEILGLTLTHRIDDYGRPSYNVCGFPHHALDTYLPKLVRAGERAAIVEAMPDPHKWACGVPNCSFRQVIAANTRD